MMLGTMDNVNYWSVRIIICCCLIALIQLENRSWEYEALMLGGLAYMTSNFLADGLHSKLVAVFIAPVDFIDAFRGWYLALRIKNNFVYYSIDCRKCLHEDCYY